MSLELSFIVCQQTPPVSLHFLLLGQFFSSNLLINSAEILPIVLSKALPDALLLLDSLKCRPLVIQVTQGIIVVFPFSEILFKAIKSLCKQGLAICIAVEGCLSRNSCEIVHVCSINFKMNFNLPL